MSLLSAVMDGALFFWQSPKEIGNRDWSYFRIIVEDAFSLC